MALEDERSLLEDGLLQDQDQNEDNRLYTSDSSVDIHGKPALKQSTGNWKACFFILGTECCERLAFFGISTNLVSYLTKKLHEGNVSAARNVTIWQGTCYLTPLIGAVLADTYFGRYWIIAVFSTIYFMGMCALTLSASVPALSPAVCTGSVCPPATAAQYAVFFSGLYLVALGTGGIKPCVSPFGADQFDDTDSKERLKKGSFFNWFYFSIYVGILISSTFVVWVQDNVSSGLGFGIPAFFMGIAIAGFLCGTPRYRFQIPGPVGSPITRIGQVLVASCRKWNLKLPKDSSLLFETQEKSSVVEGSYKVEHTSTLRFLDKAAIISDAEISSNSFSNPWRLCTVTQVEELKTLFRLLPIWATGIFFSAVYAQVSTTFVEQGMMMDTTIGSYTVPPASLLTFDIIAVLSLLPMYDRLIVPLARKLTGKEKGITEVQRMGIGLFISVLCMIAAAVVEIVRLQMARELDLIDKKVPVPLSVFWQVPQYFLMGSAEVFTYVGQLEFFYVQSPDAMRSLGTGFCLCTVSLGYYLSSLILTVVTYFTRSPGGEGGWITDNLNEGHLDYFFWILVGFSSFNLLLYIICAKKFKQKKWYLRVRGDIVGGESGN